MGNKVNVYLKIMASHEEVACAIFSRVDSTLLNFNIVDSFLYKYNQYPYLTLDPNDEYRFDKYIINILQEMGAGIEMKQLYSIQNDFGEFSKRYKDITFYPYIDDECGKLLIHPDYKKQYECSFVREIHIIFDNHHCLFTTPMIDVSGLFDRTVVSDKYLDEELNEYHLEKDKLPYINIDNISEKDWTKTKKLIRENKYFRHTQYINSISCRADILF